ncbi:hypothetical protein [Rhizobium herbae]
MATIDPTLPDRVHGIEIGDVAKPRGYREQSRFAGPEADKFRLGGGDWSLPRHIRGLPKGGNFHPDNVRTLAIPVGVFRTFRDTRLHVDQSKINMSVTDKFISSCYRHPLA